MNRAQVITRFWYYKFSLMLIRFPVEPATKVLSPYLPRNAPHVIMLYKGSTEASDTTILAGTYYNFV